MSCIYIYKTNSKRRFEALNLLLFINNLTLFPYTRGKSLLLDATYKDTFSPSNMMRSAIQARAAANEAESRKRSKYASPTDRFDFQPILVETSGVFGESTIDVVVRMSILDTKVAGSKLSINMFSP